MSEVNDSSTDSVANKETSDKSSKQTTDNLDELLDSALEDFSTLEKSVPSVPAPSGQNEESNESEGSTSEPNFMAALNKLEDFLKQSGLNAESADPLQLSEELSKLNFEDVFPQGNPLFAQDGSPSDLTATLVETFKHLTEDSENLRAEVDEGGITSLLNGLGMGGPDMSPTSMPFMQSMLFIFMSKELFYPPLKEILNKFPIWLEENKDKITENDFSRYQSQLEFMQKVCQEFEAESETDSEEEKKARFQQILSLMEKVEDLGQLPQDLVGADNPFTFDASGNPNPIAGLDPSKCSIM